MEEFLAAICPSVQPHFCNIASFWSDAISPTRGPQRQETSNEAFLLLHVSHVNKEVRRSEQGTAEQGMGCALQRPCNQRASGGEGGLALRAEGPFVAPSRFPPPMLVGWLLTAYGSKFAFSILAHLARRAGGEIVRSFVRPSARPTGGRRWMRARGERPTF